MDSSLPPPAFFHTGEPRSPGPVRSRWLAGLLSFFLAGLGQLYCSRWRRALVCFLLDFVVSVATLLLFAQLRVEPLNLGLSVGLYLTFRVWVAVDAVLVARAVSGAFRPRWFTRWYVCLLLLGWWWYDGSVHAALLMRDHVAEAFHDPTCAMADTLLPGDTYVVDKLFYTTPRRGDVAVYWWKNREGERRVFAKRIVGLPGEQLEIRDDVVWIDGRPMDEPYVKPDESASEPYGRRPEDFGPVDVPEGSYFMLGDYRHRSKDSRFAEHGSISRASIIGRVTAIFASCDPESGEWRWSRFGKVVR